MIKLLLLVFLPLFNYLLLLYEIVFKKQSVALFFLLYVYVWIIGLAANLFWSVCLCGEVYYISLGRWINCGLFIVKWGFMFDPLSVSMLFMVSLVSGCVHLYSIGYMYKAPGITRFLSYLSLFTFFMFILVTSDNFVQLFLGWEGIGLCSFLLIGYWNNRIQANKASLKALIINRIGDFGFLFGVTLVFFIFRSVDFNVVFPLAPYFKFSIVNFLGFNCHYLDCIGLSLFLGSIGKSAQLGLHTWLPDAMEGPTPVSALIHAATLVTAGVFLVIRCSTIYEQAPYALIIVLLLGGSTAFFAATVALAQQDIKKIIAYSTCSQLGYMFLSCGLSGYSTGMFHLINHAFFKALLFLAAGSVIHAMQSDQDIRKFGKLVNLLPFTYSLFVIGSIALSGLPFLSGFYSKDLVVELAFGSYTISGLFVYWLGTITASLTAFYSFRIVFITFYGEAFMGYKYYLQKTTELPLTMGLSMVILVLGSIFSGFLLKDAFVGVGSTFWNNSVAMGVSSSNFDCEFTPFLAKRLPLLLSILGVCLAFLVDQNINFFNSFVLKYKNIFFHGLWFLGNKWYFDFIYNHFIGYFIIWHAYETFYKLLDKGFFEVFGPNGISTSLLTVAKGMSKFQTGHLYQSNCLLVLGLLFLFLAYFVI